MSKEFTDTEQKQQLVDRGDAYYITIDKCGNPDINKNYYYGPPICSAALPDGIQLGGWNDWSMYLKPSKCPKAVQSYSKSNYIFLRGALDRSATCLNSKCPFNTDYVKPQIKKPSIITRVFRRIVDR